MFKEALKNRFLANIVTLMSGTVIAQALPIMLSPWISRIYTPEDFATLALILPIISIGALISTLRLDVAIIIPKEDSEATHLLISAFLINISITILSLIITAILFFFDFSEILFPKLNPYLLWTVPLGIFAIGTYQILNYWSTRCKTYRNNAISKIIQSTTTLLFSIVIGYLIIGPEGLIIGFVMGFVFGSMVLIYRLRGAISKPIIQEFNKKQFQQIIKKYRNFLIINTPHAILDIVVDQGIIYLMKVYFTEKVLGGFAFAYRYTRAPLSIITSSIYQVFYEQASKLAAEGKDIRPLMFKIQKNLFLMGIIPFILITIFTPQLFAFVFSEEYRQAGEIAQYLMPWIFMNFLVSPISAITLIYNKQKQALLITIIDFSARIIAILVGGIFLNYTYSFILISIFCTIILIFATLWYYKIAKPGLHKSY
ncbi:MAG: oligosaccharide flippase family protein [Bacteroidota bacterium]